MFLFSVAADRSMTSSIVEAREAMTNVACDVIKTVSQTNSASRGNVLLVPQSLRLLPLYMLSMIKSVSNDNENPRRKKMYVVL